jgi:hypothetical protein
MGSSVPIEYLRERFNYDPDTGVLTWRNGQRAGHAVGYLHRGYLLVTLVFHGRKYTLSVHRIIFAIVTGEWPPYDVDHRDGVRNNNRWNNLRACTRSENKQNLGGPLCSGSSSILGVSRCSRNLPRPWRASIKTKGHQVHLGFFTTKEEAGQAYLMAKIEFHPFGARIHG